MPHTENLWQQYGIGADVQIWAVETAGYNNDIVAQFKADHQVTFPFFSTSDEFSNSFMLDSFPITHTPWYYVICLDKSVRHVNFENIPYYIEACTTVPVKQITEECRIVYYSNSSLYFDMNSEITDWNLKVYCISGSQIVEKRITVNNELCSLNLSLKNGIYLVMLENDHGEIISTRLIFSPE